LLFFVEDGVAASLARDAAGARVSSSPMTGATAVFFFFFFFFLLLEVCGGGLERQSLRHPLLLTLRLTCVVVVD
jgi:hypothetical protein